METRATSRRSFLGRVAALLAGVAAIPAMATPARASRHHRRYGGYYGRGYYGRGYGRGYYGGGYPGGYYGRGFYGRGFYGGYPGGYYGGYPGGFPGGFYGNGLYGPGYGGPGIYLRLNGPEKAKAFDPLSLLEV